MDMKLNWSDDKVALIQNALVEEVRELENIVLQVWTEIPLQYQNSYYQNEAQIMPDPPDFETWQNQLEQHNNVVYSVVLLNNEVVASVLSGTLMTERNMNLWHTNNEFRGNGYGRVAILQLLDYLSRQENRINIRAWDLANTQVRDFLLGYGFENV